MLSMHSRFAATGKNGCGGIIIIRVLSREKIFVPKANAKASARNISADMHYGYDL